MIKELNLIQFLGYIRIDEKELNDTPSFVKNTFNSILKAPIYTPVENGGNRI